MELLESDSARPRQARYQAALRPDMKYVYMQFAISRRTAKNHSTSEDWLGSGGKNLTNEMCKSSTVAALRPPQFHGLLLRNRNP